MQGDLLFSFVLAEPGLRWRGVRWLICTLTAIHPACVAQMTSSQGPCLRTPLVVTPAVVDPKSASPFVRMKVGDTFSVEVSITHSPGLCNYVITGWTTGYFTDPDYPDKDPRWVSTDPAVIEVVPPASSCVGTCRLTNAPSAVIRARGSGQALVYAEGDFGRAELAQCVHNRFTEGCVRIAGIIVSE